MHKLLPTIRRQHQCWRTEAAALFRGQGSFGNGSAMRVAPLGAYFADDLERIHEQASLSSLPTHTHPEALAGAAAVALATGLAWQMKNSAAPPNSQEFLRQIHEHLPDSYVQQGIGKAIDLPPEVPVEVAVERLGNGSAVSAPDTVPFALW